MPHRDQEIMLLRKEVELLMQERQLLLQVVGVAASMVASLDSKRLPVGSIETADLLATVINRLPEETLQDALGSVHAEIEDEALEATRSN
jgi:hypothetical protein